MAQPASPTQPAAPAWPANEAARPARVTWNGKGLKIDASNSSLAQILHDVSTSTGAKIEGFQADQRVFGTYGPGPAREVLSKLLDGSGYNVLIIGGAGDAPPAQIVLSASQPAGQQLSTHSQSSPNEVDEEAEEPQPAQPQMPQRWPQQRPSTNRMPMSGGMRTVFPGNPPPSSDQPDNQQQPDEQQ